MDHDRARTLVRQHAETARLMGVDFVPSYRTGSAPEPAAPPEAPLATQVESKPPAAAPREVRDRAAVQAAMDALRARYEAEAPHDRFVTDHTRIVWADGDVCARLMFIGEAPGAEEDKQGIPFVGRAGQLLNKMIVAMGLTRETIYIANVLKTRPPNNATPTADEIAACEPFLHEQIEVVRPEVIVTLGRPASQTLLRSDEAMGRMRGRWTDYRSPGGLTVPVMPTYHPAFLLRQYTRENREKVWSDLQQVMTRLGLTPQDVPAAD